MSCSRFDKNSQNFLYFLYFHVKMCSFLLEELSEGSFEASRHICGRMMECL